jgi:hypothetical protein
MQGGFMVQIGSTPPYQPGDWGPRPPAQGMDRTQRAQASNDITQAMLTHPDKRHDLQLLLDKINSKLPDITGNDPDRYIYQKSYDQFKIELNDLLNRP